LQLIQTKRGISSVPGKNGLGNVSHTPSMMTLVSKQVVVGLPT